MKNNTKDYKELIAPCGMNCSLCLAYLRPKNKCPGCRLLNDEIKRSCVNCTIRKCEYLSRTSSKFCYECEKYPCRRLKQLDARYRKNTKMSMIDNLNYIKMNNLNKLIRQEIKRWKCPTCHEMICVHRDKCLKCSK